MIRNHRLNQFILHVITPITLGGLIYISFRSKTLRMFSWIEFIGLEAQIFNLREHTIPFKQSLPTWFYFSLPDGLWIYSFTSALLILSSGRLNYWISVPVLTGIFVEIAQGLKIFPGTFDLLDLAFSSLALLLSIIIINQKFKQNEETVF